MKIILLLIGFISLATAQPGWTPASLSLITPPRNLPNVDFILDFESGSSGDFFTDSYLQSVLHGVSLGTWTSTYGANNSTNHIVGPFNLPMPLSVSVYGTPYAGTGSRCLALCVSNGVTHYWRATIPNQGLNFSCAFTLYASNFPGTVATLDVMQFENIATGKFAVAQLETGPPFRIQAHSGETPGKGVSINLSTNVGTYYYVTMNIDGTGLITGSNVLTVYNSDGSFVGVSGLPVTTNQVMSRIKLIEGPHSVGSQGQIYIDNVIVSTNGFSLAP